MNGLDGLRARYPWPPGRPDVSEDWHGWLCKQTAAMLARHLGPKTRVVVETGSWLGLSARHILQSAPHATLICADTWEGSPAHHHNPLWAARLPRLYETFCANLWPWRLRVIPVQADSLKALAEIAAFGIAPELVYLDSLHTFRHVTDEILRCHALWPDTPLVGDDYYIPEVQRAVRLCARQIGRKLTNNVMAWSLQ